MKNVETLYSLSPLQHGLLFHSLAEPESRVYQQQLSVSIEGPLDEDAFARAWEWVIQRHPVLRTAFLWEGLDDAYQVVHQRVASRLQRADWRGDAQRHARLPAFCQQEQQTAIDLRRAPLHRLCLIRLEDSRWQFVWTHHHIVLDGWSVGLVLQDWFAAYRALSRQAEPVFSPVRPYEDYIAWLSEQSPQAAQAFWKPLLQDFAEPTPLPAPDAGQDCGLHGGTAAQPELPCAEQSLRLSATATASLQQFARSQMLTPATLIAAAWGLLLAQHAGRAQALFGLTLSGRPASLAGAEDMVGLFINTLPLRVDCQSPLSIRDWLQQLQNLSVALQERCYTPLSSLKALSAVPDGRDLFESIVVFENFPVDESLADSAEGLRFRQEDAEADAVRYSQGRNNYPLTLAAVPGEQLELIVCYRRDRLSDRAGRLILEHMQSLLLALMAQAERPLAQLDWLAAEEEQRLLDWGRGQTLPLAGQTLSHMLEQQAALQPQAAALATLHGRWTYGELDQIVNAAAQVLEQTLGDGQGRGQAIVALALPRSAAFIMASLACWKAGAAYLPLDVQQPPARLRQILADSGARCLIAAPELAARLGFAPALAPETLLQPAAHAVPVRATAASADGIAYIIYTSGSTGQPKGVRVAHRAAAAYAQGLVQALHLNQESGRQRFGLVSTLAADLGLTSVFGAWASGGCLCLPDEEAAFDPLAFAAQMQSLAIDVLKITPSHMRGLLDAVEQRSVLPARCLIFGGEALDSQLVARIRRLAPELQLFNHYGPTETTVGAVYHALNSGSLARGCIPLGRPLPNRLLRVVNAQGQLVPVGVPGELWIGGAGLAEDYLGQPDLSSERFLQWQGQRFYRSGDRVRWTVDGQLDFLGRSDRQVKLRGYRIELGEVETQLRGLSPHIEQVLLRLHEQQGSPQLLAYIVGKTALNLDKLRQDLAQSLPAYMLPSAWISLDALPLNANGKVDLQRLPLPDTAAHTETAYVAARDELEQILIEIWQQVLKLERIGVHDNFFSLGGDSILNLQIVTRAQQRGLKLTPKQVFERRTVAELAQSLRQQTPDVDRTRPQQLPLSAGQWQRLQAGPLTASWRCLQLQQSLSLEVLNTALQAVQAHHPGLQLGLRQEQDGWVLHRLPAFKSVSATPATAEEQSLPLTALAERRLQQLDCAQGESVHGVLLTGATPRLLLLAHPLMMDECSWSPLLYDLALAIEQQRRGETIALSYNGGCIDDWLGAQVQHARSEALEATWEEWLHYAGDGRPQLPLPAGTAASTCRLSLDEQTSARLDRLRRQLHVSWSVLLATAVAGHAAEMLDSGQLLLELQAGRPDRDALPRRGPLAALDIDVERLIGCLEHGVPLFIDWSRQEPALQQMRQLEQKLQALPLRGADYGAARYLSEDRFLLEPLLSLPQAQIAIAEYADETAHVDAHGVLGAVLQRSAPASAHALHLACNWDGSQLQLQLQGALTASWSPALHARLEMLATLSECGPAAVPLRLPAPLQAAELGSLALDWSQIEAVFPVSPMQHGLLFESRLAAEKAPSLAPYRVQHQYEWQGPLDVNALQQAWSGLHAHHAMLRSGFIWRDGDVPLQVVYRHCDTAIEVHDWRGRDNGAQALARLLQAERSLPYALERPPLDRLRLFRLSDDGYVLARCYHHVLSDAWSFALLIQELSQRYEVARRQHAQLRARVRPYHDYLRWLQGQDSGRAQAYWRQELGDLESPTTLPILHEAAAAAAARMAQQEVWLGVSETQALNRAAQATQTTLNTWVQAAWALLLARYSDSNDVVFGTTVAGRPPQLAGIEHTVGLFINTLPLRVRLSQEQTLTQMVQALLRTAVGQREFEYSALSDIARCSALPQGQSLFDSIVVFENAPGTAQLPVSDYRLDLLQDDSPTHYPLSLIAMPGDRLGLRLYFDSSRLGEAAATRLLAHLGQLLRQMPAAAERPLGELELLTPEERQQMLVDWNRSQTDFPLDKSYGQLFAEQVRLHAHKTAAVCGGQHLTYGELEQRSNDVAHALLAAGAAPDGRVALLADRGLDLLVMMIATLKSGAAFQTLDTTLPAGRLLELLQLGGAAIVLATADAARRFPAVQAPATLLLEQIQPAARSAPLPARSGPQHLAYVVFTSGSTGQPKGAMVEQRGLLNNLLGKIPALGLRAQDRLAQTAALSFDIAIWQLLAAPLVGATVHILDDDIARDPRRLLRALDEQAITLVQTVPSMLRALLDDCPVDVQLQTLRWMISIGEALPPVLCRRWFARFPSVPLLNLYGPAECADNIGAYALLQAPPAEATVIPVGYPTANNQLYVLDRALRPVPVGVPGEICAAGMGVGRGYLNDAQRTAEVFLPHPWQAGARLYRTGDIGRYREDGAIEYLGRRDQQIKIRGQRIELGEIENRIARHPAVAAVAVIAQRPPAGDIRLLAYWQPRRADEEAGTPADPDLRTALADELTAAQMPEWFIALQALPLNVNGKIDRKALTALPLPHAGDLPPAGDEAEWSEVERRLAALWKAVLGPGALGRDANFFALGGHSLLAAQLIGRIRSEFAVELPLKAVFDQPQLAALAQRIAGQASRQTQDPLMQPIPALERSGSLPLSHAQQRLWFMEQLQPGSGRFNIPFLLRLRGPLDVHALQAALLALIQRQEILRTGFVVEDGQARQCIMAVEHLDLPLHALGSLDEHDIRAACRDWLAAPFDLSRPPLLRAGLWRYSATEYVLAGAIHHIATDAWSLSLLVNELAELYRAESEGVPPTLPPLTRQYADYAVWQRDYLQSGALREQMAYWRQALQDLPDALHLPGRRTPAAAAAPAPQRYRLHLPQSLAASLDQLALAQQASLFMLLNAAWATLLHLQTGRGDIVFGTDVNNRRHPDSEGMQGFFVNQLVLRHRLRADMQFEQLLQAVKHTVLAALQQQDVPFDAVVAELAPQRQTQESPLFNIKLVVQNAGRSDLALTGVTIEELPSLPQAVALDLQLNAVRHPDSLELVFDFDAEVYPAQVVQQLAQHLATLLSAVILQPQLSLAELLPGGQAARPPGPQGGQRRRVAAGPARLHE